RLWTARAPRMIEATRALSDPSIRSIEVLMSYTGRENRSKRVEDRGEVWRGWNSMAYFAGLTRVPWQRPAPTRIWVDDANPQCGHPADEKRHCAGVRGETEDHRGGARLRLAEGTLRAVPQGQSGDDVRPRPIIQMDAGARFAPIGQALRRLGPGARHGPVARLSPVVHAGRLPRSRLRALRVEAR